MNNKHISQQAKALKKEANITNFKIAQFEDVFYQRGNIHLCLLNLEVA